MYAIFSEKQSKLSGTSIWRNAQGKEIEVSEVRAEPLFATSPWLDKIDLGEVVEYVRQGKAPQPTDKYHEKF